MLRVKVKKHTAPHSDLIEVFSIELVNICENDGNFCALFFVFHFLRLIHIDISAIRLLRIYIVHCVFIDF